MAYQVLARKWRPRNFEQMVGQEHVLRALVNALDNQRLHHAYLFTGTRGVGKTTVARVFAKSLNCETGVSSKPCGECSACLAIDAGRFVDLIEVDAASRTGVDDTRELLENVQYTPTEGRYKVYLIDEVHMFSNHSFNALLKTLEEPPPHVKFLLATTDPQKLPVTILSRCLQFNLKRLSGDAISGYLGKVLDSEGIAFEAAALGLIARGADGSMRDGLSLLDQAIAFGGGRVAEGEVRTMLGTIAGDQVFGLLDDLAGGDAAALMERIAGQAEMGVDYAAWLADLLTLLQRIALVQQVPAALDDSFGDPQRISALAERIPAEDAQLFYQIGLIGRRDLPLSPEPRGGFEMVMLRMLAFRPVGDAPTGGHAGGQPGGQKPVSRGALAPPAASTPAVKTATATPPVSSTAPGASSDQAPAGAAPPIGDPRQSRLSQVRALLGESSAAKSPAATVAPKKSIAEVIELEAAPHRTPVETRSGLQERSDDDEAHRVPEPQAADQAGSVDWLRLMPGLGLESVVRELASHCVQRSATSNDAGSDADGEELLTLALAPNKSGLLNDERITAIRRAVADRLGRSIRVEVAVAHNTGTSPAMVKQQADAERLRQAQRCIAEDSLVQAMQERLGASVLADSVRPLG